MKNPTTMRVTIELQESRSEFVAFNEVVVVADNPVLRDVSLEEGRGRDVVTVWPQCSGTIDSVSDASPSAL